MIRYLNIYPVESFFLLNSLSTDPLDFKEENFLIHTNRLFWSQLLSEESLKQLTDFLIEVTEGAFCDVPQYNAIISDTDYFLKKCQKSVKTLFSLNVEPRDFFSASETLQIACNLYSDLIYNPVKLHLNNAFVLPEYSSVEMINGCLNEETNPYLNFIAEYIYPEAKKTKPELIILQGGIRFSNLTTALLLKKDNPEIHISISHHQNEYYSLNKITDYLKNNTSLFNKIDSIILDDFDFTEKLLIESLSEGSPLTDVPNLLYSDKEKGINQTAYKKRRMHLSEIKNKEQFHPEVFASKLWLNNKCYWSACSFCSINEKYKCQININFDDELNEIIDFVKRLEKRGVRYLLMQDEAIPPQSLYRFALALLENDINVFWETRSKIDKGFTPEIINTLHRSGLRRIMIGLESSNPRILKLMNKLPEDFELDLIEKNAGYFNDAGVIIHYCTILGFPTETADEMNDTLNMLEKLRINNRNFVFNINLFNLDIGSELFRKAESMGIEAIFPCPVSECLSVSLSYKYNGIEVDRAYYNNVRYQFNLKNLYNWVPETAYSDLEIIDYCSTMNAFIYFCNNRKLADYDETEVSPDNSLLFSSDTIISEKPQCENGQYYLLYNWQTHYQWEIDSNMLLVLEEFRKATKIIEALSHYAKEHIPSHISFSDVKIKLFPHLKEAIRRGFLILKS